MNNRLEKMIKSPLFYLSAFMIVVLSLAVYFITCFSSFPKEINLFAGTTYKLNFNLPVQACITNEDIEVVNINSKKVSDNIHINLKEPLSIESGSAGKLKMELSLLGIPFKDVSMAVIPNVEVVPCGMTVGVKINTDGVMVLGTGFVQASDGGATEPSKGILKSGDLILAVDDVSIVDKEGLIGAIEKDDDKNIRLKIKRDDSVMTVEIKPVLSELDHKNKIGVWVRDSTQGIGTVTFYNPDTKRFGALGHGILDVDTKQLMSVRAGEILGADILSIKKGKKGSPGELLGDIHDDVLLGTITENIPHGLYGVINEANIAKFPQEKMPIGLQDEVQTGPAKIRSNVVGHEIKEYDIEIETVNKYSSDNSKGMIIRITDPALLEKTNGIVQGMSGSPIIQNGKLIGAVTHVFVQDSTKGYGIFIENMM